MSEFEFVSFHLFGSFALLDDKFRNKLKNRCNQYSSFDKIVVPVNALMSEDQGMSSYFNSALWGRCYLVNRNGDGVLGESVFDDICLSL